MLITSRITARRHRNQNPKESTVGDGRLAQCNDEDMRNPSAERVYGLQRHANTPVANESQ